MPAGGDDLHALVALVWARVTLVIGAADDLLAIKASVSQSIPFVLHFLLFWVNTKLNSHSEASHTRLQ